jgi:hypothetical protein
MNQGHLLKCTVLNTGNTPSIVKLYWDAGRWMEFLQVPEHWLLLLIITSHWLWRSFIADVLLQSRSHYNNHTILRKNSSVPAFR